MIQATVTRVPIAASLLSLLLLFDYITMAPALLTRQAKNFISSLFYCRYYHSKQSHRRVLFRVLITGTWKLTRWSLIITLGTFKRHISYYDIERTYCNRHPVIGVSHIHTTIMYCLGYLFETFQRPWSTMLDRTTDVVHVTNASEIFYLSHVLGMMK